ncbi:MAG: hypothetical protein L0221_18630, partial [Chloroflexi bacterium]|nr:hypothetical protein [Chloroflexota bacterium]
VLTYADDRDLRREMYEAYTTRASVRRVEGPDLLPDLEQELRLEDVELVVREGAPVVPVTVRLPWVLVDLSARTLRTDEAVVIEGPRLSGSGRGLLFDEPAGLLRLEQIRGRVKVEG